MTKKLDINDTMSKVLEDPKLFLKFYNCKDFKEAYRFLKTLNSNITETEFAQYSEEIIQLISKHNQNKNLGKSDLLAIAGGLNMNSKLNKNIATALSALTLISNASISAIPTNAETNPRTNSQQSIDIKEVCKKVAKWTAGTAITAGAILTAGSFIKMPDNIQNKKIIAVQIAPKKFFLEFYPTYHNFTVSSEGSAEATATNEKGVPVNYLGKEDKSIIIEPWCCKIKASRNLREVFMRMREVLENQAGKPGEIKHDTRNLPPVFLIDDNGNLHASQVYYAYRENVGFNNIPANLTLVDQFTVNYNDNRPEEWRIYSRKLTINEFINLKVKRRSQVVLYPEKDGAEFVQIHLMSLPLPHSILE